jgi:hypothetical protein
MLNILSIVSYNFLPPKMGGQKGIGLFYSFFGKQAHVTCVTTRSNDISFAGNYEVLNILSENKLRYANVFYFFTLKKIIRRKQITHLIIEHPYYGWLGILLKKFCKVKFIVHSHNIEALRFKSIGKWWWNILWQYEKFTHRKADTNFFITDEDRAFAIKNFGLDPSKCTTVTYGMELNAPPAALEKQKAKKEIRELYDIAPGDNILLFNGTLSYKPNRDAVDVIVRSINPRLAANKDFRYKIIICGKGLPEHYSNSNAAISKNIIYAGFVDDINIYFLAADIFINPVIEGGGIKTKIVEALGYNMNVVTTGSGAIGVPLSITGEKMKVVADGDWEDFTSSVVKCNTTAVIPKAFFDHFFWEGIAKKAADMLQKK